MTFTRSYSTVRDERGNVAAFIPNSVTWTSTSTGIDYDVDYYDSCSLARSRKSDHVARIKQIDRDSSYNTLTLSRRLRGSINRVRAMFHKLWYR